MTAKRGKVDVVRLLTEAGAQLNKQQKVNVHIMDVLTTLIGYTCTRYNIDIHCHNYRRCCYNYVWEEVSFF